MLEYFNINLQYLFLHTLVYNLLFNMHYMNIRVKVKKIQVIYFHHFILQNSNINTINTNTKEFFKLPT